jgi:hypothetical protein
MQVYYEDRSEVWQESDRGESHQADLDAISETLALLDCCSLMTVAA